MQYRLTHSNGSIMFYVQSCAEVFRAILGGSIEEVRYEEAENYSVEYSQV